MVDCRSGFPSHQQARKLLKIVLHYYNTVDTQENPAEFRAIHIDKNLRPEKGNTRTYIGVSSGILLKKKRTKIEWDLSSICRHTYIGYSTIVKYQIPILLLSKRKLKK